MGLLKKNKAKDKSSDITIGLALGGGGTRGFAHIGAIKAFEQAGIDFDLCVGTSAGSLVGALYCAGIKSAEMIDFAEKIDIKQIHNGIIFTPNDALKIGKIITDIIGDARIENLPKKFCAVAVDLVEAKQVFLQEGKIDIAVSASCCVPMFFRPVIRGEKHLVDGGLLNNIPADVCKMLGADKVVTVDINPTRGSGTKEVGLVDVIKASFGIMSANSSIQGLRASDILIAPDMSLFKPTQKDGYLDMIQAGYNSAMEQIEKIKAL